MNDFNNDLNIYGFGLLRNGVKYDYCFEESLKSLVPLTKKTYLALGDSEDETQSKLQDIDRLHLIHTIWDLKKREGGIILSEQTNIALDYARKAHRDEADAWGIYLQCDEVFHEDDYDTLREDINKAKAGNYDAIAFRYLHFWQSHHQLAINKKWYPHEIRAIKLASPIESWGDAQGFRHQQKVFYSEVRIFHYGHVREQGHYRAKKESILKLYHSDEKISKYQKREKRFDDQTEIINFWGLHPKLMHDRIIRLGDLWTQEKRPLVDLIGNQNDFDPRFIEKIHADEVQWHKSLFDIPSARRKNAVVLVNIWPWHLCRFLPSYSTVPSKMRSKLARTWSSEFLAILKLSEKGISILA